MARESACGRAGAHMVEHLWIRLAELREEAALENWRAAHPRAHRALEAVRRARIRCKLARKWLLEQPAAPAVQRQLQRVPELLLRLYLCATRWVGRQPSRARVAGLRTGALMAECQLRGLDSACCVEREDLLELLCGPAPLLGAEEARPGGCEEDATDAMDKMV